MRPPYGLVIAPSDRWKMPWTAAVPDGKMVDVIFRMFSALLEIASGNLATTSS